MTTMHSSTHPQRGAAALVVVMVLFFIMSLVAAYASRNLIFEQRTSANNYRATQAFDAAEAGLEWAIAMFNGGRIDAACASTADPTATSFRDRYLVADANGFIGVRQWLDAGVDKPFLPSCVRDGTNWSCSCPNAGDPALTAPSGTGATPTFRISFEAVGSQPGLVRIYSRGCSGFGTPCYAAATGAADANGEVSALLGLAPSMTQSPAAAMTVRGPGTFDPGLARFSNPSADGVAVNTGGPVNPAPIVTGPAGTPLDAVGSKVVVAADPSLSGIVATGTLTRGEMMFLATFGVPPGAYRVQPAVVRITCGPTCATQLNDAAAAFPGRVLWIDGDLVLGTEAPVNLGTGATPAVIIVDGDLNFAAGSNVAIQGLVYARGTTWTTTGSSTSITGAFVAEGDPAAGANEGAFSIVGDPIVQFDVAAVEQLQKVRARQVLDFGSFARVPGSWRDFR